MKRYYFITLLFIFVGKCFCQTTTLTSTRENFNYKISKSQISIKIDGDIDKEWNKHVLIDQLYNHYPDDKGFAAKKTEIKLTYDNDNIYILAKCFDNGKRFIQSLERDNENAHWQSDNFTVVIDPINNKQNGFMFGVNAYGAEIESSLSQNGSRTSALSTWDNKWDSKVKQFEDYWLVEIAIPFKTLRFKKNNRSWGINFIRRDMETNYHYTWTQFPLNFVDMELNYMGTLIWDEDIPKGGRFFNLIPYTAFSSTRNFEDEEQNSAKTNADIGLDAKIAITSSLNLDVTINPDFSNADIDEEVTNITRFNIYLPEKRSFFLEGNDIFANFGSYEVQPFFSRKIGLDNGTVVPITYGARVTGNITKKTRIGLLNVSTSKEGSFEAQNYSVVAVQQQVFGRSVIKGLFINRQQIKSDLSDDYSRNFGVEYDYISKNGKLNNSIRVHTSNTNENLKENHFYSLAGNYNTRRLRTGWNFNVVGENYITDVGIAPRLENYNAETGEVVRIGFFKINPWVRYLFYSKNPESKLIYHGLRTWHNMYFNNNGSISDRDNNLAWDFRFKNTSSFTIDFQNREVNLPFPTSLLGDDFEPLPVDNYLFNQFGITYSSDNRNKIKGRVRTSYGDFFNGTRFNFEVNGDIRLQSWGNLSLLYNYNNIKLASGFGERELHLLSLNGSVNFSNKMRLSNLVQYNSQNENFSLFARFQWRYLPMSDLFIIFNENHSTNGFNIKNRSLILKLTYWF